jgi:hypothetical protein
MGEIKKAHTNFAGKPEGRDRLGDLRHVLEENT